MNIISSKEDIYQNLSTFDSYRTHSDSKYRNYYNDRLRLGKIFLHVQIASRHLFAPSRFLGYEQCTLEKHEANHVKDGKETTPAISKQLGIATQNTNAENAYRELCRKQNIQPANKVRTYWSLKLKDHQVPAPLFDESSDFPNEVAVYVEGATKQVIVNAYERNSKARRDCLAHHGYDCSVCSFNFGSEYGKEIGEGFMHVHHLTLISGQQGTYEVDPINDLKPVCPNCHAMLHKRNPPYTIEELQKMRESTKKPYI